LNAEVVSSIGLAPATILFGTAINLDRGIFIPNEILKCSHSGTNYPEYVAQLIAAQKHAIEFARLTQQELDRKHLKDRVGETITVFPNGSFVLMEYAKSLSGSKKPPHKLMTKLRGPYRVLSHRGPDYVIEHLADKRVSTVTVTRLRPFVFDPKRTDPKEVAAKDISEFQISHIIDHRPRKTRPKRSEMEFLVHWEGYDDSHDTWEPWEVLKANEIVHAYCASNKMKHMLPRKIFSEGEKSDED
jgi:hypothetical protein